MDRDLIQELNFLRSYDQVHRKITAVIDGLPRKDIDRFIKFCSQNGFCLGKEKREKFFFMLKDEEVVQMEAAVRDAFEK